MVTTNNFCTCITLQTGSVVIGILLLIIPGFEFGLGVNYMSAPTESKIGYWLYLVSCLVQFCGAFLLLVGINERRHKYVFYHLMIQAASVVLHALYIFLMLSLFMGGRADDRAGLPLADTPATFLSFIALLVILNVTDLYMLVVVHSYYTKVLKGSLPV